MEEISAGSSNSETGAAPNSQGAEKIENGTGGAGGSGGVEAKKDPDTSSSSAALSADGEGQEDVSDQERKIIEQVEYYFGDINLPRDRFLAGEAKKDNGWIPMTTMIKFNRLKQLSEDFDFILSALKKSQSGILEVDSAEAKVRRSQEHPLPDNSLEYWKSLKLRTVYVKGFPRETKLDDLQKFFAPYGKPAHIMMRRVHAGERTFKGSVFVTYSCVQDCEEFLKNCPTRYSEASEMDIIKMKQEEFYGMKAEQRQKRKLEDKASKRKHQQLASPKKGNKADPPEFQPGIILRVSKIEEGCTLKLLKKFFMTFGRVHFVNFVEGGKEADVTFAEGEKSAEAAWEKAKGAADDGKVKVNDCEIEGRVLDGEEAQASWDLTKVAFQKMIDLFTGKGKDNRRNRGGGDGFSYKGKQRGKRGGGRDQPVPAPQGKKKRFSSDDEEDVKPPPEEKGGKRSADDGNAGNQETKEKKMKSEMDSNSESIKTE